MRTFYHSGKIGDIIYSLPTFRAMGGGTLVCGMAAPAWHEMYSFMIQQFLVVNFCAQGLMRMPIDWIDLSKFRQNENLGKKHLVDVHAEAQGIEVDFRGKPWLRLPQLHSGMKEWSTLTPVLFNAPYAVVNITSRYRDRFFNWTTELNHLFRQVRFVYFLGTYEEYEMAGLRDWQGGLFRQNKVEYLSTYNLMEAAYIIRGAEIYSGNQSALLAIRQGLGLPYRMEQSPHNVDCVQRSELETILNPRTRRLHMIGAAFKAALKPKQI